MIKHIFFDWDGTIWDFKSNSKLALKEIFDKYSLSQHFSNFEEYDTVYHHYNDKLWALYRKGEIEKKELSSKRFFLSFEGKSIQSQDFAELFNKEYLKASTTQTLLFPFAKEIVSRLSEKYTLHIITNGFSEVQFLKIKNSGLAHFFTEIITSEEAGALKPNAKIFEFALAKTEAKLEESILIGDDIDADIKGAIDFRMKNIFFNSHKKKHELKVDFEISELKELEEILLSKDVSFL